MGDEKFCTFCCDYEVSMVNLNKKKDCMEKCKNALNNIVAPEITVRLNLVQHVKEKSEKKDTDSFRFK